MNKKVLLTHAVIATALAVFTIEAAYSLWCVATVMPVMGFEATLNLDVFQVASGLRMGPEVQACLLAGVGAAVAAIGCFFVMIKVIKKYTFKKIK
jgi:hypothetical protein